MSDGTIEEDFEKALAREVADRRLSEDNMNVGNLTLEGTSISDEDFSDIARHDLTIFLTLHISNSSDNFTNSVTSNLRIFSTTIGINKTNSVSQKICRFVKPSDEYIHYTYSHTYSREMQKNCQMTASNFILICFHISGTGSLTS